MSEKLKAIADWNRRVAGWNGDIPRVVENIDVLAWMPLPEPPEVEE